MEYRILGPLEVLDASGHSLSLGGARQQSVLASLLLRAGHTVALERLIDELWEERPETAAKTVQVYVSRLRHELPAGAIESRAGGYALLLDGDRLDLRSFEQAANEGRAALAAGDCERAAELLRQALALWRGPALAGLYSDALRREAERLEELRLRVLEDRLEADLGCAREGEVVPELQALVSEHPLRERPRAQLMLALYRADRQAEALALYRETRSLLVEELGLEPSEELQRLERQILAHDPEIEFSRQAVVPDETAANFDSVGQQPSATSVAPSVAANRLPTGTVTFVFTDIEGSTALAKRLPDGYAEVLQQHQLLLRAAFERHGGHEIDMQGDSFFFAFARAKDAVVAVVEAQRALTDHEWPEGGEVRVRIGLHTGEPAIGEQRYSGFGVHRAARISAAGHGGQVLLSNATRELVEDDLPENVAIRDLGTYQLKDIDRPEHLFQLAVDGLPTQFPPLQAAKVAGRHPLRRRAILLFAVASVIAAAVAIPIFTFGQGRSGESIEAAAGNSVGFVDPDSNRLVADVKVGTTPTHLALDDGTVWVTNADDHTVSRIDPVTKAVVQTIAVGSSPSGIATGNGAVWVTNSLDGTVSRIDPATNTVVQTIRVGNLPVGIAYAAGSIWVANTGDDTVTRIDADSGRPGTPLPIAASELTFGAGTLWASERTENRVARVDPTTGRVVQTISVGNGSAGLAFGSGAAWVANGLDGTVTRINPATNSVAATIPAGNGPTDIAVGARGVWVSNQFEGTLARIDPRTNQVVRRITVGNRPQGVAISGGDVLVSVRQSGAGHRGGTLTVRTNRSPAAFDTAVAYDATSWLILRMTGDGLVAFNQASGLQGTQLVPDLAVSLPTPTDGGRTYTFRLRPNIRYSNGRPLKASDVRSALERDFKVGIQVSYYDGIVGAARCAKNAKRCDLSHGIVADDPAKMVTFHLVAPDPEFLYKLALPFAYVVPAGTPPRDLGTHPLPATGPYVIANYRPKHVLRLGRNPHFHEWSQAAQPDGYPDEIVFEIGGAPDEAVNDVIRGKADAFSTLISETSLSEGRLAVIKTQHASQVHTNPQPTTVALFLNTRLAPFDRLDVRRALNYAANRAAAVDAAGGSDAAQATCQILPPHFPGYRPYCPYTVGPTTQGSWTAPDLAKARALIARSGTRGMKITVWSWADLGGLGPYAVKLLRSLGYRASMKVRSGYGYFSVISDSRTKAQIGTYEWISDYLAASGFFTPILSCASFLPNDAGNQNVAEFCDPRIDRQIEQALTEQATNPEVARGLWERIDRQTVDQAPWVPLVNPKVVDVLSKRVGNYQYGPQWGMLIDQLWVR